MTFHEHCQIPSGTETVRDFSGLFRIKQMKYVDVYFSQRLMRQKGEVSISATNCPPGTLQEKAAPFYTG